MTAVGAAVHGADLDSLSLVVGAGLVVISGWIGWVGGRISGRRSGSPRPARTSELICSCGHGYGTHENEQRCHGVDPRRRNGMQELDPCPCHHYDGPEPLPRAWQPPELPRL